VHQNNNASLTAEFDRLEIPYTLDHLKCGDILIENTKTNDICVIERKVIDDLVLSVLNGRLAKEVSRMNEHYSKSFLIIEGNWDDYYAKRAKIKRMGYIKNVHLFSNAHKIGAMVSILARTNTKIIETSSKEETVQYINTLAGKLTDGKVYSVPTFRTYKTEDKIYLNLLMSFPGVSENKAYTIMRKYPNWINFFDSIKNKTFELPGFGEKTVNMFYKYLNTKV
jgi:ERCC4-type nuclease